MSKESIEAIQGLRRYREERKTLKIRLLIAEEKLASAKLRVIRERDNLRELKQLIKDSKRQAYETVERGHNADVSLRYMEKLSGVSRRAMKKNFSAKGPANPSVQSKHEPST